ncbi:unnamed protein product [Heterosigma akashiwo]
MQLIIFRRRICRLLQQACTSRFVPCTFTCPCIVPVSITCHFVSVLGPIILFHLLLLGCNSHRRGSSCSSSQSLHLLGSLPLRKESSRCLVALGTPFTGPVPRALSGRRVVPESVARHFVGVLGPQVFLRCVFCDRRRGLVCHRRLICGRGGLGRH